ncbi:hypothetical protein [Serratia sp. UGAL515B_01]|nr:hypothetical protein [Serratia sp. UGAL515B_01]WON77341.1 hypothetical protein OK023_01085 [Serratia sp. UGAL515B_01]
MAIPVPELDVVADDLVMLYRTRQENRPALRAVIEYLKQSNDVSVQE